MDDAVMTRVAAGLLAVRNQTRFFGEHFGTAKSEWKHDGSRVTHADLAISKGVFDELRQSFPEDEFFSEETDSGAPPQPLLSRFAWIVDPIDGTNNYALGIPMCAISLGLLERGMPVCGFIYDFGLRALFHGGPGIGFFMEGSPVARVVDSSLGQKILAVHTPVDARNLPLVERLIRGYKIRAYGSGALHLTYVALGRIDVCLDLTVKVWDIAAAWAFCRVTGIEVCFLDEPVFPLRVFDVHMKPIRYMAGPAEHMARLLPIARESVAGGG